MRLLQEDANKVKKLEDSLNVKLEIEGDIDLHMEEYRIISLQDNREIYLD
jgi:hypothetical protein